MTRRPGGLTAICLLALVLGLMELFSCLSDVVLTFFGLDIHMAMGGAPPSPDANVRVVLDQITRELADFGAQSPVWTVTLKCMRIVVAATLLVGSILSLKLNFLGWRSLSAALVASVAIEIMGVPTSIQMEHVLEKHLPKLVAANAPLDGQAQDLEEATQVAGRAMAIVIVVAVLGMTACKCVFYLIGLLYLRRRAVAELFIRKSSSELKSR
jgi:hypothetical protein